MTPTIVSKDGSDGPAPARAEAGRRPIDLKGLKVLLVEDEALVAMLIEGMLSDLGCEVVGTIARVAPALEQVSRDPPQAALLDVNLAGEKVFPLADRLAELGVPFVFSTGYGTAGLEGRHCDRPVLQKPFTDEDLQAALLSALREA